MADYQLHCFAQSGNAYKAALMLNLCQADWEPIFVDFFKGANRSEAFREQNIMGEVPILEHNGKTLTQSGVILDYLSKKLGQFGAKNEDQGNEILRWILFDNHKLTSYTGTLRFLRKFTDHPENEVTEFLEGRAKNALKVLDQQLKSKTFATGDSPTIADLSMCGYLYFEDELGFPLTPYANINRWLTDIKQLPGWQHPYDLMPGHPIPA